MLTHENSVEFDKIAEQKCPILENVPENSPHSCKIQDFAIYNFKQILQQIIIMSLSLSLWRSLGFQHFLYFQWWAFKIFCIFSMVGFQDFLYIFNSGLSRFSVYFQWWTSNDFLYFQEWAFKDFLYFKWWAFKIF